jgi:hypothetical protein
VAALETAGDAMEAIGRAFSRVGMTISDEVDLDARVVPFFETLGATLVAAAQPARDGAAAVRRAEAERIRNVEEATAKRRKWDIGAHD